MTSDNLQENSTMVLPPWLLEKRQGSVVRTMQSGPCVAMGDQHGMKCGWSEYSGSQGSMSSGCTM